MIYDFLGFVNKKYFLKESGRGASSLFGEEGCEREVKTRPWQGRLQSRR